MNPSLISEATDMLYCVQLVLASLTVSLTLGQVNQEIYSEQDLLAIDSESHNTVIIAPPPANFLPSNSVEGKSVNFGENIQLQFEIFRVLLFDFIKNNKKL